MGSGAKSPSHRIEPSEEHAPSEQELAEYQTAWHAEATPSERELAEIEAAWEAEVLRIAKEHAEGRAESVPWEQVQAELFGKRA